MDRGINPYRRDGCEFADAMVGDSHCEQCPFPKDCILGSGQMSRFGKELRRKQARELWKRKLTVEQIANILRVKPETVYGYLEP